MIANDLQLSWHWYPFQTVDAIWVSSCQYNMDWMKLSQKLFNLNFCYSKRVLCLEIAICSIIILIRLVEFGITTTRVPPPPPSLSYWQYYRELLNGQKPFQYTTVCELRQSKAECGWTCFQLLLGSSREVHYLDNLPLWLQVDLFQTQISYHKQLDCNEGGGGGGGGSLR